MRRVIESVRSDSLEQGCDAPLGSREASFSTRLPREGPPDSSQENSLSGFGRPQCSPEPCKGSGPNARDCAASELQMKSSRKYSDFLAIENANDSKKDRCVLYPHIALHDIFYKVQKSLQKAAQPQCRSSGTQPPSQNDEWQVVGYRKSKGKKPPDLPEVRNVVLSNRFENPPNIRNNGRKSQPHRIYTLNVNSLNDEKFDYLKNFLTKNTNSMIALTELVSENSELNNFLACDSRFPILNDNRCKRVGLMIPKYLENYFEIVDVFTVKQARKRKSQTISQVVTFKFQYQKIKEYISVVYQAPDVKKNSSVLLMDKISEYAKRFPNYVALGDFNADFSDKKIKSEYKSHIGGILSQVVDKPTRQKNVNRDGKKKLSSTIIDLVFLSDKMKKQLVKQPIIHKDSPSDHYMVECQFDLEVPQKYTVYEYFLDPTRRPPLKGKSLKKVLDDLENKFSKNSINLASMTQDQIIAFTQKTVRDSLDKFNPLNKAGIHRKKIFATPLSKVARNLQKARTNLYNQFRFAKRNGENPASVQAKYELYAKFRNAFTAQMRAEQSDYNNSMIDRGLSEGKHVWDLIKRFQPRKEVDTSKTTVSIDGKSGVDLANKMASYIDCRAHLVPEEEIKKHADFIPFPNASPEEMIDLDDSTEYKVEKIFKTKKPGNLSCGPDTISLGHVHKLMPVLGPVLQAAIDKPLENFVDIKHNFNRLISKEVSSIDKPLTVKSQRPIAELDVIPKYGSIKIFIDKLKKKLVPLMKNNQFSFPGKGSPMAIVKILDTFSAQSKLKKKTILAIWDFSNAFCTISHEVILKIAEKYNLSPRIMHLLSQFLEQSFSIIKMSDKDGYYRSDEIHTGVGGQQGQIGSDFVFALSNENIDPEAIFDEFVERIKYVDDFNDILASESVEKVLASLAHNIDLLLKMSTSVGLKLNDTKTQLMCGNMTEDEIKSALGCVVKPTEVENSYTQSLDYTHKLLGFSFKISKNNVNVSDAVSNLISRLNGCCRVVSSMRKHGSTPKKVELRVDIATKLVWAACYDIGLCYSYCSKGEFSNIERSIRKVIKSAGLDWMTPSEIIYKISTKLTPEIMAKKQMVQLGIKFLDAEEVAKNRYLVPTVTHDELKPFWKKFKSEFNELPIKLRKTIIDILDPENRSKMDQIKDRIKSHYLGLLYPLGVPEPPKIEKLIAKHLYSWQVVLERKRGYEERCHAENFTTPSGKRNLLSSKSNRKLVTRCLAPQIDRLNPPKRIHIDHSLLSFSTSKKRTNSSPKADRVQIKRKKLSQIWQQKEPVTGDF